MYENSISMIGIKFKVIYRIYASKNHKISLENLTFLCLCQTKLCMLHITNLRNNKINLCNKTLSLSNKMLFQRQQLTLHRVTFR